MMEKRVSTLSRVVSLVFNSIRSFGRSKDKLLANLVWLWEKDFLDYLNVVHLPKPIQPHQHYHISLLGSHVTELSSK